ncbi:MAG: hypothetical protein ABL984_16095 [Pyrinomonadaceae bacterium]
MGRPTENAIEKFKGAASWANSAKFSLTQIGIGGGMETDKNMEKAYRHGQLNAIIDLANGLTEMATGLRATYILLEEVKRR